MVTRFFPAFEFSLSLCSHSVRQHNKIVDRNVAERLQGCRGADSLSNHFCNENERG